MLVSAFLSQETNIDLYLAIEKLEQGVKYVVS